MRPLALALVLFCAALSGCRTNESPEAQVNDLEITASVKSKLASDVGLSTVPNIDVNSTNGVVTLSGQVNSAAMKEQAETIAKSVPHVAKVVNNLQVTAAPRSELRQLPGVHRHHSAAPMLYSRMASTTALIAT
jgi:BON domain-containing protein